MMLDVPPERLGVCRKVLARKKFLDELKEPKQLLNLYAGNGKLIQYLYKDYPFSKIINVEKDSAKIEKLKKNFSKNNIVNYNYDNLEFLEKELQAWRCINVVDFDAYGLCVEQLKKFFENYLVKEKMAVFLTNGAKCFSLSGEAYELNFTLKKTKKKIRLDYRKRFEYFDNLMEELAELYHFKILKKLHLGFRNYVLYNSYLIEPEVRA